MIINRENLEGLTTAYTTIFNESFTNASTYWQDVAMEVPSTTTSQSYDWLGDIPTLREWVGDKVVKGLSTHGFTIVNKPFELTIGVSRDKIEDDQYGIYKPIIAEMGRSGKIWPDQLVFELIKKGHSELCYDGQYFFDTDHPVGDIKVSNYFAGSETSWYMLDTSRAIKPFIFQQRKKPEFIALTAPDSQDVFFKGKYHYGIEARGNTGFGLWQQAFASQEPLNAENFKKVRSAMEAQKNSEGVPLAITPNVLVVPATLRDAAEELINTEKVKGTNNTLYKSIKVLTVPYL